MILNKNLYQIARIYYLTLKFEWIITKISEYLWKSLNSYLQMKRIYFCCHYLLLAKIWISLSLDFIITFYVQMLDSYFNRRILKINIKCLILLSITLSDFLETINPFSNKIFENFIFIILRTYWILVYSFDFP